MGFPAAEVAAGVAEVLAARALPATRTDDGERTVFETSGVRIAIGPLPDERRTLALFQPRCLLALSGRGALADVLKEAIRVKFLRVTG
jgi:hypothetical protein